MKRIKDYVGKIDDEICGAKKYAEDYVYYKALGTSESRMWSEKCKEMALDELKHATYVHDRAVAEINQISMVYTPPAEMQEKWDESHKHYVEKVAWIKQMLSM